jgi:hypothetical protein
MMAVEWKAVESSLFTSAAYRPYARQLYLRFHDAKIYRYFDVPVEVYEAFLAAESKGRYFSRHIRNVFRYERIGYTLGRTGRSPGGSERRDTISAAPRSTQPA